MCGINTRVWAYDNSPRVKPRQSAYHVQAGRKGGVLTSVPAHHGDPAPPLRMGPQRCLSSRDTIERLSTAVPGLLPAEPYQVERTLKRAAMHWRDIFAQDFPEAARYFPQRAKPRTVWMGGDYIDDGTHKATPEEAAERWREVREAIVEASKRYPTDPESARLLREETLYGSRTYCPPHTRDTKPRG